MPSIIAVMGYMVILIVLLALLTQLPGWWTRYLLQRHNAPLEKLPGGGGEFAAWLLKRQGLSHIPVYATEGPDHYDPIDRCIRLNKAHYDTPSLTALAVAAHEVGHALQHAEGDPAFLERLDLVQRAAWLQKLSAGALILTPVLIPLLHTPLIGLVTFATGFIAQGVPLIIHLKTLPVEWDASFNRALPLMAESGLFTKQELSIIKRLLHAAALTYVAQALASLFNLWRWLSPPKR